MSTLTAAHLASHIGRTATLRHGNMTFEVVVVDVRTRFGSIDFEVEPAAGTGSTWVSEHTIKLHTTVAGKYNRE